MLQARNHTQMCSTSGRCTPSMPTASHACAHRLRRRNRGHGLRSAICAAALPPQLFDLAEAAVAASDASSSGGGAAEVLKKSGGGWLEPLTTSLEQLLQTLQTGLDTLHVPYSYGYSIILLTLIVKTATFPLTRQQVESTMAVQSLKPRIDLIKARYGEDQDKISKETSVLYKQAGVNPLAGCLPTIATIPIFIGLYSSLTNVASQGLLDTQGFYWIPSLAGPTSVAERASGSGTAWLLPFVDGAPASGWDEALPYLSLPVMLVVAQFVSTALISVPPDPNDKNAATTKAITSLLPFMVGWFALNVPSGLALYYLSNTLVTTAQQVYLRKLGGANIKVNDLGPVTRPGSGRRTGVPATDFQPWQSQVVAAVAAREAAEFADDEDKEAAELAAQQQAAAALAASVGTNAAEESRDSSTTSVNKFVKRKRLDRMQQA